MQLYHSISLEGRIKACILCGKLICIPICTRALIQNILYLCKLKCIFLRYFSYNINKRNAYNSRSKISIPNMLFTNALWVILLQPSEFTPKMYWYCFSFHSRMPYPTLIVWILNSKVNQILSKSEVSANNLHWGYW